MKVLMKGEICVLEIIFMRRIHWCDILGNVTVNNSLSDNYILKLAVGLKVIVA